MIWLICVASIATTPGNGIDLKCIFQEHVFVWGSDEYTCNATGLKVDRPDSVASSVLGDHRAGMTINEVSQLLIDYQVVHYIPAGIANAFTSLRTLIVSSSQLKHVARNNFEGMKNLMSLLVQYNDISEIPDDAFVDLDKLEYLALNGNDIRTLPDNVFSGLRNLKRLHLNDNKLVSIGGELFGSSRKLEVIWLQGNRLRYIGSNLLAPVPNVKEVFLGSNVCIHNWFPGPITLEGLKQQIADRCDDQK